MVRELQTSVQWFFTKATMPAGNPADERFVMSKDQGQQGAKVFAAFEGHEAALSFARAQKGGALYEVVEHSDRPCKMFFDIDRPDTAFETGTVLQQLLQLASTVLREEFAMEFSPEPGVNCQVAKATTAVKTSLHAVFDIRVASVAAHRFLAERLAAVALDKADAYPALVFTGADKVKKCVIDRAIYTMFRSFRMLYMVKLGKDNALMPFAGSSIDMRDHLVGYYPSLHDGKLADLPAPTDLQQPLIKACRGAERVTRVPVTVVPSGKHQEIETALNAWTSVQEMFPGGVRVAAVTESPYGRTVRIHKLCGAQCPYAKRPHKSNNLYLKVALDWTKAEVKCFDEDCQMTIEGEGGMLLFPDANNNNGFDSTHAGTGGMHSQADNVVWDERYDEPSMRALPVKPIVCVRANMGIGKTVAIGELLWRVCLSGTKVLIVTFSRALAVKMSTEFAELGFVNYQDIDGLIQDAKVVTCLDSLYRVATRNFDYIILDECVSTFLHFNSTLMNKRAENSALLELLLTQASSGIYFVDAALDFTFMKSIVDYFAVAKRATPYWIYNEHVRSSNRQASIVLCEDASMGAVNEYSLIYATAMCVLENLQGGKKVVCCSSTKKFTEVLGRFIADRSPNSVVRVYNSSTASDDLRNVNTEWIKYDLLIYSPSISAGVSFETQHFDCLVGYLVNSPFTSGVDKALQQLFRVRQLNTGEMRLFVHNTQPGVQLPHTVEDITPLLSSDVSLVSRYFVSTQLSFFAQVKVTPTTVEYDRERLSWQIILGIIQMHNSSAMFFTDTLVETLRKDYGIMTDVRKLVAGTDKRHLDLVALQEAAAFRKIPEWADVRILTNDDYIRIKGDIEHATAEDRASVKMFDMQHAVWGVKDELVDENFYLNMTMNASAMDDYYRATRFKLMTRRSLGENKEGMARKFEYILGMDDKNLELYKAKTKNHHLMLVTGHIILSRMLGVSGLSTLGSFGVAEVSEEHVDAVIGQYKCELSASEVAAFLKLFGLAKDATGYRVLLMLARKAFNIELTRMNRLSTHADWRRLKLTNTKLPLLESRYKPAYPNMVA
jgi:hypothetical protein